MCSRLDMLTDMCVDMRAEVCVDMHVDECLECVAELGDVLGDVLGGVVSPTLIQLHRPHTAHAQGQTTDKHQRTQAHLAKIEFYRYGETGVYCIGVASVAEVIGTRRRQMGRTCLYTCQR